MRGRRTLARLALAGLLAAPLAARADGMYSFVDEDGVLHVTNVPSDARYKKVRTQSAMYGTTRKGGAPRAQARAIPSTRSADAWRDTIRVAAKDYNLPEELLLAVMAVESGHNPEALSEKGAVGLMQLMPGTAKDMFVQDAWNPHQNIQGGARYLRILANQYQGDLELLLAAYNAGPEAVRRAGNAIPDIPETRAYVAKVIALYRAYKAGR